MLRILLRCHQLFSIRKGLLHLDTHRLVNGNVLRATTLVKLLLIAGAHVLPVQELGALVLTRPNLHMPQFLHAVLRIQIHSVVERLLYGIFLKGSFICLGHYKLGLDQISVSTFSFLDDSFPRLLDLIKPNLPL